MKEEGALFPLRMEHLLGGRDLVGWPLLWTLPSTHLGTYLCPPWAQISTPYQPLAGEKPYCSWPCQLESGAAPDVIWSENVINVNIKLQHRAN